MNLRLTTILLTILVPAWLHGQQEGKPPLPPPGPPEEFEQKALTPQDSLVSDSLMQDSLRTGEYIPLWESDTLYRGADSIPQFIQAPLVQGDTAVVEPDFTHDASKALMYALVLPGLGQAYNKKYWKMPIVWAAFGGAGYAINYNTQLYKFYSEEFAQNPNDSNNERFLRISRRYLELSYIALVAVYALQVLDAYVDAQLYSWDVNDNLSMQVVPAVQPMMAWSPRPAPAYGLTCSFQFRRK
jgi:hypothetical protein